jgi:hypothetical protein
MDFQDSPWTFTRLQRRHGSSTSWTARLRASRDTHIPEATNFLNQFILILYHFFLFRLTFSLLWFPGFLHPWDPPRAWIALTTLAQDFLWSESRQETPIILMASQFDACLLSPLLVRQDPPIWNPQPLDGPEPPWSLGDLGSKTASNGIGVDENDRTTEKKTPITLMGSHCLRVHSHSDLLYPLSPSGCTSLRFFSIRPQDSVNPTPPSPQ